MEKSHEAPPPKRCRHHRERDYNAKGLVVWEKFHRGIRVCMVNKPKRRRCIINSELFCLYADTQYMSGIEVTVVYLDVDKLWCGSIEGIYQPCKRDAMTFSIYNSPAAELARLLDRPAIQELRRFFRNKSVFKTPRKKTSRHLAVLGSLDF